MQSNLGHILMVEDNPNDEELTLESLKESRIANPVDVCRDGEEALDYLYCRGEYSNRKNGNPVVVLLDLKLPKVDGHEVLKTIRADDHLHLIPVVLLTSSREDRDMLQGYENGTNSFVVKPVNFIDFSNAIRELGSYWGVLNDPPPGTGK